MRCEYSAPARPRSASEPFLACFQHHLSPSLCFFFAFASANSFVSPSYAPVSRNPFVSPTYAKTGGYSPSSGMTNCSISKFPPARCSRSALSSASPLFPVPSVTGLIPSFSRSPLTCPPKLQRRRATSHSPLSPTIPAPLATAALRVVPAPIVTTTSSIHVGPPTFLRLQAGSRRQNRPTPQPHPGRTQRASKSGRYTDFELSTFNFEQLFPFFS